MELNTNSNQASFCDAPGNLLHTVKGPKLENESGHCVNGKHENSQDADAVSEKVDSDLVPVKSDTQAVNVLNGEYCGLFTQLSIDYVDIFEILREEIIAAEARELEMDDLLNAGEDDLRESSRVEGIDSTLARYSNESGIDRDDCKGEAQSFKQAADVDDAGLISQKRDPEQAEPAPRQSAGIEAAFLKEVEEVGAEDEAAPLEDKKAAYLKLVDVTEAGQVQRAAEEVERVESSTSPGEEGFEHAPQHNDKVDHEETLPASNVKVNEHTFFKEDEGAGTYEGKETLLDGSKGDDGDHLLNSDVSDKASELSEDEDYTSSPFSGPIAFSGMLSYSGMIPYSGQIPYSGNMSLHSDSSTSTRSFAFPILASDWNSSPAKIGPPDSRYFRRRRRWGPLFCCRRPATLFD